MLDVGVLSAPADTNVKADAAATFSCDVTKNTEFVPTVSWFKDTDVENVLVAEAEKRTITATEKTDSTLSVLVLLNVEVADKGEGLFFFLIFDF